MSFDDLDLEELRARTGEKWRQYGDEALAAWVADMDFAQAPEIRRALATMIEIGDLGYPQNPTPQSLPTVFSERMAKRFRWSVDPQRVEVITEVVQGLYVGLEVYSEPGDGAVIQTPIYPPFLHASHEMRRRAIEVPLVPGQQRHEIDFDRLRASIDARTRIFMLCNPHNPCGRVFTRSELEGIAALALEHDLVVLADEIHADLVFSVHEHVPFATLGPEVEARTVTFMSASKSFNIAGLRCAVAAFGSDELKRRFMSVPRHLRGGIGSLGLVATRVAWEQAQGWLDRVLLQLERNRDFLSDFLARELPEVGHLSPEGTYLAWLDLSRIDLPTDPASYLLERARVALSDGTAFGTVGKGHVRLNFATSLPILREILERTAAALRS